MIFVNREAVVASATLTFSNSCQIPPSLKTVYKWSMILLMNDGTKVELRHRMGIMRTGAGAENPQVGLEESFPKIAVAISLT